MANESQGALSLDELHEMAALAQELGDDDAELEAREAIDAFVVAGVVDQPQEVGFGQAADETLRTLVQNSLVDSGSGLAGLFSLARGKSLSESVDAIDQFKKDFNFVPSERSQAQLQDIGGAVKAVADPILGAAAAGMELEAGNLTPESLFRAATTFQDVQDKGFSQTGGDRVLQETGSEELAALATALPTAVGSLPALAGLNKAASIERNIVKGAKQAPAKISAAVKGGIAEARQGIETLRGIELPQSARKKEIGLLLSKEPDVLLPRDISTVGFDLINPPEPPLNNPLVPFSAVDESGIRYPIESDLVDSIDDFVDVNPNAANEVATILDTESFRVKNNRFDKAAQKHGLGNGMISFIKGANGPTRAKLREMTDLREKARNVDDLTTARPSDVVGETILDRVEFLQDIKSRAGKQVGIEADNLAGVNVDYSVPLLNLKGRLESDGVSFRDGKIDFSASLFNNHKPSQKAIIDTLKQFSSPTTIDGQQLHFSKKWLDETMKNGEIGNTNKPISDTVQRSLMKLRADVNQTLRNTSEGYKRANVAFSDTIQAIDDFDKSMGSAIDVGNIDEFTKAGVGTKLRAVFSNQAGRGNMSRAIASLDDTVKKYGGDFQENVIILNSMATALDNRFGNIAPHSFGGQIKRAADVIDRPIASGIDKASKKLDEITLTEEKAFNAFRDLIAQ